MNCPICKENSVEDDTSYGRVCTSCGFVVEDNVYENNIQLEGTTAVKESRNHVGFNVRFLPHALRIQNSITISKGKEFGLAKICYLASHLHLSPEIKKEVEAFFTKMVDNYNFKFDSFTTKVGLVACCTYIVLRQKDFPIMISRICNFLQCSCDVFSKIYKAVLMVTKISITTPSIDELVPSVLKDITFGEEMEKIKSLVFDILHIAQNCWVTFGRTPRPYIIAAGFIAWKSLSYERRKYPFPTFCKKMCLTNNRTPAIRVGELSLVLLKLAEELPWVEKGSVDKKDVPYKLESILKHSKLLCSSAIESEDKDEQSTDVKQYQTFRLSAAVKRKHEADSDRDYSSDFDDKELDIYIRTEKEIEALKLVMQRSKSSS